jgi:hypothetical protein
MGYIKNTWEGINCLLYKNKKQTETTKVLVGNTEISDPVEVSNAFSTHFTTMGPKLAAEIYS